jgi:hypothetical protein
MKTITKDDLSPIRDQLRTLISEQVWGRIWTQVQIQAVNRVENQIWIQVSDQLSIQIWDQLREHSFNENNNSR